VSATVDWQVGDYERCACSDERADIVVEVGWEAYAIREVLQIRHPAATARRRNPLASPALFKRLQPGEDIRAGQSFDAANRCYADFDAIPVHISGAIRSTDDDRHGPFRCLFRRPFESPGCCGGFAGEQETWLDRLLRSGIIVGDYDSHSDRW